MHRNKKNKKKTKQLEPRSNIEKKNVTMHNRVTFLSLLYHVRHENNQIKWVKLRFHPPPVKRGIPASSQDAPAGLLSSLIASCRWRVKIQLSVEPQELKQNSKYDNKVSGWVFQIMILYYFKSGCQTFSALMIMESEKRSPSRQSSSSSCQSLSASVL